MNSLIIDKTKAASIHLIISLILATICFFTIFFIWYPAPLFKATGVGTLFFMMLIIDVILGPALTFLIYKKLKKTLTFDLLVIAIIQLVALGYGVYSLYEGRPIWLAFAVDRFELIRANDIVITERDSNTYQLKPSQFGPQYIYVDMKINSPQQKLDMMLKETQYGISPAQRPEFYRNFNIAKPEISKKALPLSDLYKFNSSIKIKNLLLQHPKATAWLPLKANATDMVILINQSNSEIIKIIDLRPW